MSYDVTLSRINSHPSGFVQRKESSDPCFQPLVCKQKLPQLLDSQRSFRGTRVSGEERESASCREDGDCVVKAADLLRPISGRARGEESSPLAKATFVDLLSLVLGRRWRHLRGSFEGLFHYSELVDIGKGPAKG